MKNTCFVAASLLAGVLCTALQLPLAAQTITTIAGGFGDNMEAKTYARFGALTGIACDTNGTVYIADRDHRQIRKVPASGKFLPFYDTINYSYYLQGIGAGRDGYIYFADQNARIFKMDQAGNKRLLCGTGSSGYSGDGGPATAANISGGTNCIIADRAGNVYFIDNYR
ncbi:MAG: hypothetical protein EBZ77_15060, partial [Chitinophagia bacterium]|nr:hypothetical protein [Chitinophagia bacterium]